MTLISIVVVESVIFLQPVILVKGLLHFFVQCLQSLVLHAVETFFRRIPVVFAQHGQDVLGEDQCLIDRGHGDVDIGGRVEAA